VVLGVVSVVCAGFVGGSLVSGDGWSGGDDLVGGDGVYVVCVLMVAELSGLF